MVARPPRLGPALVLFALVSAGFADPLLAKKGDAKTKEAAGAKAAEEKPFYDPSFFSAIEWRNVGPFRGGRSTAVAGVVGEPHTYYFGGVGGGLFKTTDGGLNWKNISDGFFETGSVGAIAVAPSDPNVIWVGMGESPVRGVMTTHGNGVYRSTDAGRTWQHLGLADTRHIAQVRVHPRDPDTAFIAVQGHLWGPHPERGVYKTTDGGKTFRRVLFVDDNTGAVELSLDPQNPRILYAALWQHRRYPWKVESGGPGSGLYKSTDSGETWTKLEGGLPEKIGKSAIATTARPDRVFALLEAEEGKGGLYRSDDAGKSWNKVNGDQMLIARAWYYTHLFTDPVDADTVWVLNAPALRSIDGGKSFTRVRTPHGDNHDLWIDPQNSLRMINANDGGANISINGGATWSSIMNQPTAQIYRVITDNQIPYRIYGGQQDNTSLSILSRSPDAAITERDWQDVGGCESAYVAFDPNAPRYIYAGCYQGIITEYDMLTRRQRDVMAVPFNGLGAKPAEMPYRFNWNAPILVSPHDPQTIYHAGNHVLQSTDRGRSWQEISPDLTRDEEDRQDYGGGPFTSEGAGGEIYGTITTLVESPHEKGVLWAGTDDGLVHRRRGDKWENHSPAGVGDALINAIEVSPHDPKKVYLAITRYKWDDLSPMIRRSTDDGLTFQAIDAGLPKDTIVRVVREDPARAGLLYAGTERGLFVSWDDGAKWQKLQANLPVVPITDLKIQGSDLVASTQGRAFWVLDDLTPIRQVKPEWAKVELELLSPRPAYAIAGFRAEEVGAAGKNPHTGMVLYYVLGGEDETKDGEAPKEAKKDEEPLVLEIFDDRGKLLRRFTSVAEGKAEPALKTQKGLNRFVWDLSLQPVATIEGIMQLFPGSPQAWPGTYEVKLSRGETVVKTTWEYRDDPKSELKPEAYAEQRELVDQLYTTMHEIQDAANRLADTKAQIEAWLARLPEEQKGEKEIREAGEKLAKAIGELDDKLVQRKSKGFQDVINYPNRFNSEWGNLLGSVAFNEPPINAGARKVFAELSEKWQAHQKESERLLGPELEAFEKLLADHGAPTVQLKKKAPLVPALPKKTEPKKEEPPKT